MLSRLGLSYCQILREAPLCRSVGELTIIAVDAAIKSRLTDTQAVSASFACSVHLH